MKKTDFKVIRTPLECMGVLLLIPWGLLFLCVAMSWQCVVHRSVNAAPIASCLKRWSAFALSGLRPLRIVWWIPVALEPTRSLWRYVIQAELLALWNIFAKQTDVPNARESYLVIRLGHPGDFLHIIPMLRRLRSAHPNAWITLLVGPWCKGLADRFPYANEVIAYAPCFYQYHRGETETQKSMLQEMLFWLQLRKKSYKKCISLEGHHILDVVGEYAIRPDQWIGLHPFPLLYPAAGPTVTIPFDSRKREADMIMDFLRLTEHIEGPCDLEFPILKEETEWAHKWIAQWGLKPKHYVVLAPGAGWDGKKWPIESYAEIIDWLYYEMKTSVVLLGSKAETDLENALRQSTRSPVISLIAKTSLGQVGAVVEQARMYVGNDNGILHIAAALNVPTLSLFGPTFSEKWAPRGPLHRVIQHRTESCDRSCYPWHINAVCENHNACMRAIAVPEVKDVLGNIFQ